MTRLKLTALGQSPHPAIINDVEMIFMGVTYRGG
jgi:hypothetical protein